MKASGWTFGSLALDSWSGMADGSGVLDKGPPQGAFS